MTKPKDRWSIHSRTLTAAERSAVVAFFEATRQASLALAERLDPQRELPTQGVVAKLDAIEALATQGRALTLTRKEAAAFRRNESRSPAMRRCRALRVAA